MSYNILLNQSGTHRLDITQKHIDTIARYRLFADLIGSDGYVTEEVLEKLRLTVHALINHQAEPDRDLLNFAFEVLFISKMKAYGLRNLIVAFAEAEKSL